MLLTSGNYRQCWPAVAIVTSASLEPLVLDYSIIIIESAVSRVARYGATVTIS